jgi:hypothetical protein
LVPKACDCHGTAPGPNRRAQESERAATRAAPEGKRTEAERKAIAEAQKIVAICAAIAAGLAKAVHWAARAPAAANEIFNISNGDCFLFEQVFPRIAEVFSMPCGAPHPMSLARVMGDKSTVWDDIVRKHQLQPYRLRDLVPSWEYADFTFRYRQAPFESLLSTIKARKAGFHECVDS